MKNRIFIALNIDKESKEDINKFIKENLFPFQTRASWARPENMHITLAFIGKIKTKLLERLIDGIKTITFNPFTFQTEVISGFPNIKRPRVIWIGTTKKDDQPCHYYTQIIGALNSSHITFDKKPDFIPHITLARLKGPIDKQDVSKIEIASKQLPLEIKITSLSIYESILSPNGAKYIELMRI